MSLAYKVEELLALRDSISESAVSIDRFADEDVIKEHVLRPSASASANLASRSSGRSLRPPVAQPLAPAAPHKRPSPTPSIKRGKAEKLLKEHGSPPGMRVTAGGRIVPSDLAPLGTSRYPDNTFKPSTLRVTPGNVMSAQAQQSNNPGPRIEIVGGQPVIMLGDRMFALPAVNPNSTATFGSGVALDPSTKPLSDPPALNPQGSLSGLQLGPSRTNSTSPLAGLDLPTLKAQQSLKKQELRTVEQTEVLQSSHQSEGWRIAMIEKKRGLIVELDALRKSITALENDNPSATQANAFLGPIGTVPGSAPMPTFVSQLPQPVAQPLYPFQPANAYTPMMMYQPPYGAFPSFTPTPSDQTPFVAPSINPTHSPGSASRRSHAIEIKPPQEGSNKPALNPKSPTYEPAIKSGPTRNGPPPTPSPPKRSPWHTQEERQPNRAQRTLSQKPSFSSVDTTDFFPTNTHEHSSTRLAPGANDTKQAAVENTVVPSTPEKHWPASPWNEGNSGRSRKNEPTSKLTSWPEAFGREQSSSSLRQNAACQPSNAVLERAPVMGAFAAHSVSGNQALSQKDFDQRTVTEDKWPFSRKAVAHVPSTYQEGYQAGYDHVGMPDSPDVLQGYIQGLCHFLSDDSKKICPDNSARDLYVRAADSRTPSLRGLVAGSMPHDSAVSMTFNRSAGLTTNHENIRSSKDSFSANVHRDSPCSPQGSVKGIQNPYSVLNEAAYLARQRNISSVQYPNPTSNVSDKILLGRQMVSRENELDQSSQDKGIAARTDASFANGSFAPRFAGAQLQNRGYNTPLSAQRFYPTPKEMTPNGFGGESAPGMRPFADHRLSGLDGAMDDLADLVLETSVNEKRTSTESRPVEAEEPTASCFKPSGGKGKEKAATSPAKSSGNARDSNVSSPNPPGSPKKSEDHSPAKAKLEHVTNKFRRNNRKDDPRTMSPEDKMRRSDKWRQRFQALKKTELEEIETHRRSTRN
ncbi:hypothetical protein BDU57DRAFT_548873 [Ampelomyces quisqualis]|uniref:Uncharacterized protein n=1 Tax=Ampelomyces quisqualis TaxID=50730 RepID=A0A6A5QHX4_AMPQU|nr:hypothetical protein BDU57DRAFT_548873 [Ampelomyces quisqualis]